MKISIIRCYFGIRALGNQGNDVRNAEVKMSFICINVLDSGFLVPLFSNNIIRLSKFCFEISFRLLLENSGIQNPQSEVCLGILMVNL